MDHKVSKDMISSGMIPSGEKTQADLGRTQYGSAPSPSKLMDAYKSMYGNKEEVINEHHQKDKDGNTIPHEGEELNEIAFLAPALGKVAAIATKGAAMAGKVGKVATKAVTAGAKKFAKSDLASDMARGAATQLGANMVSGGSGGQQKQKTGTVSATQYASADLFDIVKGQLLDEGYSEKEINEIMVNLTEEQLDEFMKALATRAAQYGANLGKPASQKIEVINPKRKPFEPKRKPFDAKPKPGDSGFRAKSASDVVNAAAAMRRKKPMDKPVDSKPKDNTVGVYGGGKVTNSKGIGNQFRGPENKKAKEEAIKKQRESLNNGADLFDIVKGQLLDEGLSEEEIRDIMLTLTPDEILNEISAETALAASKARDVQAGKLKGPENTEKRVELRAKASQNYDRAVEKRKSGFVKNTASPQGPSRIPTGEA